MRALQGLAAVLVIVGFVASGHAQQKKEEGFVPLFNGKDLTGWIYGGTKEKPAKAGEGYRVRDGVLYCTVKDGGNLFTEKEYDDFILRFEFKLTPNANNGLGIRAPLEGDAAYQGIELQILDENQTKYGKLRPEQYHGSIYDVVAAKRGALVPPGRWNTQEVIANGRNIKVKVNDILIVDANLDEITDEKVLKKHPGLKRRSGHIGFLGHGAEVEFRNIRIKEL